MVEVGLGEAIRALREELSAAKAEGDGSWMRFQPGPLELELEVSVTKDVHGQVGWKILEVGGSRESGVTQTVRLTLTPQWWDPETKRYSTDFLVAGELAGVEVEESDPGLGEVNPDHGEGRAGADADVATPAPSLALPERDDEPE